MSTTAVASEVSSAVRSVIATHLGVAEEVLDDVPTIVGRFESWRHISVQAALEAVLGASSEPARIVGVPRQRYTVPNLSELLLTPGLRLGPIDYINLPVGPDETMPCIRTGLILTGSQGAPIAVWAHPIYEDLNQPPRHYGLEVKSASNEAAHAFIEAVRASMAANDPYHGKALKLVLDRMGNIESIEFQERPLVTRDRLVLPEGILEGIESHAVGIGRAADRLREAGMHLKRGLLLYGPPGTGKTHTVRYITSLMPEATLFTLTGSSMSHIKQVAGLLTDLAPAIIVLDDVDLIAEERQGADNAGSLLFNLLDAMDGVREDVDVLFVCTSNRAENLEKAIASRPGRIDQAVEIPVPDAEGRRALVALYAQGLELRLEDEEAIIERTAGVTASFMKELLRRATLIAMAEQPATDPIAIGDRHVHAALDILLDPEQPLTPALLGIHTPPGTTGLERSKQRGAGRAWCGI